MHNVVEFEDAVVRAAQQSSPAPERQVGSTVKLLFVTLQGSYGSLFLSKFATGVTDSEGRDLGIRSTMKVWDAALSKFPAATIEAAAKKLTREHPEFPPNLPQFEAVCEALTPRKTYAQEQGIKALPAPKIEPIKVDLQPKNDGKDWARRILWRVERNDKSVTRYSQREARLAMGMEGRMVWQ